MLRPDERANVTREEVLATVAATGAADRAVSLALGHAPNWVAQVRRGNAVSQVDWAALQRLAADPSGLPKRRRPAPAGVAGPRKARRLKRVLAGVSVPKLPAPKNADRRWQPPQPRTYSLLGGSKPAPRCRHAWELVCKGQVQAVLHCPTCGDYDTCTLDQLAARLAPPPAVADTEPPAEE